MDPRERISHFGANAQPIHGVSSDGNLLLRGIYDTTAGITYLNRETAMEFIQRYCIEHQRVPIYPFKLLIYTDGIHAITNFFEEELDQSPMLRHAHAILAGELLLEEGMIAEGQQARVTPSGLVTRDEEYVVYKIEIQEPR